MHLFKAEVEIHVCCNKIFAGFTTEEYFVKGVGKAQR